MNKIRSVLVGVLILVLIYQQPAIVSGYPYEADYTTSENSIQGFDEYSKDKFVLLDAMATWCGPCRLEMVHLQDVHQTIKDNENVTMITMSMYPESDTIKKVQQFMEEFDAEWDYGLDHTKQLSEAFNVTGYPTTFLLDPNGIVLKKWLGVTEADEILSEMDKHLDLPGSVIRDLQLNEFLSNLFDSFFFYIFMIMMWIFILYSGYKFIDRLRAKEEEVEPSK